MSGISNLFAARYYYRNLGCAAYRQDIFTCSPQFKQRESKQTSTSVLISRCLFYVVALSSLAFRPSYSPRCSMHPLRKAPAIGCDKGHVASASSEHELREGGRSHAASHGHVVALSKVCFRSPGQSLLHDACFFPPRKRFETSVSAASHVFVFVCKHVPWSKEDELIMRPAEGGGNTAAIVFLHGRC